MIKLLIVFAHLLAVCTAIGAIVATDLRVMRKLTEPGLRIAPPNPYVVRLVGASLLVLYATGAALMWLGQQENPDYLANPKLQAKLLLVVLLTLNAVLLHRHTFPWLAKARRVANWRFGEGLRVAVPVAASNSLWLYCAFLGIARPWNFVVPLNDVLAIAAGVFLLSLASVLVALAFAARRNGAATRSRAGAAASPVDKLPQGMALHPQ